MTTHTWNDMRRLAVDAAEGKVNADQILDWIAAYTDGQVGKAVQAERERIAQAIEAIPTEYKHGNDRYPGYVRAEAARIARAEL